MLVVGTTGTGKTSTVNIFTGNNLLEGDTAQAVTSGTVAVEDKLHPGAPVWVDNPGKANGQKHQTLNPFNPLSNFSFPGPLTYINMFGP